MSENNEKNIENKKFNFPQNNKGFKEKGKIVIDISYYIKTDKSGESDKKVFFQTDWTFSFVYDGTYSTAGKKT